MSENASVKRLECITVQYLALLTLKLATGLLVCLNPSQFNRSSAVQWYFPLQSNRVFSAWMTLDSSLWFSKKRSLIFSHFQLFSLSFKAPFQFDGRQEEGLKSNHKVNKMTKHKNAHSKLSQKTASLSLSSELGGCEFEPRCWVQDE